MPVLIGTSGWQYESWRDKFYAGVPQRRWYEHTMTWFRTTELNVSFYRLPLRKTFEGWASRSPDDAIVTVKASRYLTHIKRLFEPEEPVKRLMDRATGLGAKLGPILLQLPPDLGCDVPRLAYCLDQFAPGTRVAVEVRNESWWNDDVRRLLEAKRAAWVWVDRGGSPWGPLWRTCDWGYLRLHWGDAEPSPNYHRHTLAAWVQRIAAESADWEDFFVYFNNDGRCAAVDNAITFGEEVRAAGRTATRTPGIRPHSWW
jgi:uncharacterized protein YecE (DUF72 family)